MRRAAVAMILCACGPTVVWHGETPDRRKRVEIVEDDDVAYVVVDGRRAAGYESIDPATLTFSPAGRVAYAARRAGHWVVVVDGRAGDDWDAVGKPRFSADGRHLAYAVRKDGRWTVVVDDAPGPAVDAVVDESIVFSPDGHRVAWAARVGAEAHAVVDGAIGPPWDAVGSLAFTSDSDSFAYAARRGDESFVVLDGTPGPAATRQQ